MIKVNSILTKKQRVKPKIIYGDSVTGDMPVTLLNNQGQVEIIEICNLGKLWTNYSQFKSDVEGLTNKEQDCKINYKVWTDKGWSNVKRVIRHKTNKKIYEVITRHSYVKVTEDHSLLDSDAKQIKPSDCKIGQKLLHNNNFLSILAAINSLQYLYKYLILFKYI